MSDELYILRRTLENKIAIAKNNDQHEMIVTLDVLEIILNLLKRQEDFENMIKLSAPFLYEGK